MRPPSAAAGAPGLGALHVLPAELQGLVFSFLKPAEIWRLRRLSKAFQSLLSDRSIELQAVKNYATHDPQDSASQQPITLDNLDAQIESMKAHHTGIPPAVLDLPSDWQHVSCSRQQLCGSHFVYLAAKNIHHLNLSTGKVTSAEIPVWPLDWTLTCNYVVLLVDNIHVICYRLGQQGQLERSSCHVTLKARPVSMAGFESTLGVIILVEDEKDQTDDYEPDDRFELHVYDLDTASLVAQYRLDFTTSEFLHDMKPCLYMDARCALTFSAHFYRLEDSASGQRGPEPSQSPWAQVIQVPRACDGATSTPRLAYLTQKGCSNWAVQEIDISSSGEPDGWHVQVRCEEEDDTHHGWIDSELAWHRLPNRGTHYAYWKGVTWTVNGHPFGRDKYWLELIVDQNGRTFQGKRLLQHMPRARTYRYLLVNESFLVNAGWGGDFTVYTFDPSATACKTNPLSNQLITRSFLNQPTTTYCWTESLERIKRAPRKTEMPEDDNQ